jgi:hypothetical protein
MFADLGISNAITIREVYTIMYLSASYTNFHSIRDGRVSRYSEYKPL